MDLMLIPLVKNDLEISIVKKMHDEPTISKYISISDNYFDYVTGTEHVAYFKIKFHNEFIGGIHTEISGTVLYLSICIQPQYRKKGFATAACKKYIQLTPHTVEKIQVSIDETNIPSVRLFENLGFTKAGRDGELVDYILNLNKEQASNLSL